jgi:endo-1,3(4)-beta-glucanase
MSVAAVVYTHVQKSRALDVLGWGDPEDIDFHFYSPHTISGLVVLIATGLQLILNLVVAFGINSLAAAVPPVLVSISGLIQVASIVTSFLGFVEMGANIWLYLAYAVWIASLIGISAILEAQIQVKKDAQPAKSIEMKRSGSATGSSIYERQGPGDRRDSKAQVHQLVNVGAHQRYRNMLHALVVGLIVSALVFGAMLLPSIIFTSSTGWDYEEPIPQNGSVVGKYPTNSSLAAKRAAFGTKRSTLHDDNCTTPHAEDSAPVVAGNDTYTQRTIGIPARGLEMNAMSLSLVQGSPFISAKYGGLTPRLRTQHAILNVNEQVPGSTVRGKQFVVRLNNGQTWLIIPISFVNNAFAPLSNDMSFSVQNSALVSSEKFSGILRAAVVPPSSDSARALQTLKDYSMSWPVGGEMSYSMNQDDTLAYMKLNFGVETVLGGSEEILMTALPHHRDNFVGDDQTILSGDLKYQTIKGQAQFVTGMTWTIEVPLVSYGFFAPRPIAANRKEAVRAALMEDINKDVPIPWDTYSFGKVASRFARLALIADELQEASARERMVGKVIQLMDPWMRQTHGDSILYDSTWGGLISTNGRNDAGADYGVGWYNDQHYHYGYFVYAAAVAGYYNKDWANSNKQVIEDMIRNYANPVDDGVFPSARMKDWYHGHSWASGLFEFADGKNQESTSESVNGYYGVYLWGLATNNRQLINWGRLLMTTEMISAHRYWHMFPRAEDHTNGEPIYEEVFRRQTCVGIMWSTKVDYATWFGGNVEFIHAIQMLPYTPITEILLPKKWIQVEYPILATSLTRQNPPLDAGWRGFVIMTQSILDQNAAWTAANQLNGWDNGNSKTNTLHFIATRPTE